MGLNDLRKEPHLSVSGVNDYVDCGMHYRLSRIDKLQPEYKSDAMEFGSVIHVVLALFYEEKMAGNILSAKELHGLFEKHWRKTAENRDDIQYAEGKTLETYILEGKELLTTFYHKAPHTQFEVMATEESFSFNIQGCPVPVIGAIDLLETDENGMLIITDFKTSSRAYSVSEVDRNFQLTVYQMAMKRNGYSDREILLRFDCLIKTKTPKYEQYYTTRNELDELRAEKKILAAWRGISSGVFIPNDSSWKCPNCAYKKHCNAELHKR